MSSENRLPFIPRIDLNFSPMQTPRQESDRLSHEIAAYENGVSLETSLPNPRLKAIDGQEAALEKLELLSRAALLACAVTALTNKIRDMRG